MDSTLKTLDQKTHIFANIFTKFPSKTIKTINFVTQRSPPSSSSPHNLNAKLKDAIFALENGSSIQSKAYIALLQSCIDLDSIDCGRRLHASLNSVENRNAFVETKLVSMYAKCGSLEDARKVFDGMSERNIFSWSAMIGGCAREQLWDDVIVLFFDMMSEGIVPDTFLLPKILQACANTEDLLTGRLLHSVALRIGILDSAVDSHVSNSVLAMYAKCGELETAKRFFENMGRQDRVSWNSLISGHCQWGDHEEALKLLEQMRTQGIEPGVVTWNILISSYSQYGYPDRAMELFEQMESYGIEPDVFTWTSMISGFTKNNRMSEALCLFREMQLSGVEPNAMTIASAISACASLQALTAGKELHSYAIKIDSMNNVLLGNSLVDMYAKCDRINAAASVFDEIVEKDVFSWNSMIGGFMRDGYCSKAYDLFLRMENAGVQRNVVTWNIMISGYIQNGDEEQAMEFFQMMEASGIRRNTATWNSLIAGSSQNGHANDALRIFRQMQSAFVKPNSVTILSILPTCANLISAWKVKEIHSCIIHYGLLREVSVANALIDTYSKSGNFQHARAIFDALEYRDIISWNSIISACVLHGYGHVALNLFRDMKQAGFSPNSATFSLMINACSLYALVDEGMKLFTTMTEEYQLSPGLEHYTGVVNLLARSCKFKEACDVIEKMPVDPDSTIWDSLLTGARIHGNINIANLAVEHLFNLEPSNAEAYRALMHLQALCGKSGDLPMVKKPRNDGKIDDSYGCCWMEVRHKVHTFVSGGKIAADLKSKISEISNAVNAKSIVRDADNIRILIEEEKEETVGIHSEKLAIAYGLVNFPSFKSIRIIKNLRMCTDCHDIVKIISKVYHRRIFIKDPKSFHHFKDGKCSCGDYW